MGRSRYASTSIVDNHHYETWTDPVMDPYGADILDGVETVEHVINAGDRLDILAFTYYGDEEHWWVIALANRIQDPFGIVVGTKLRIPRDARAILNKVSR